MGRTTTDDDTNRHHHEHWYHHHEQATTRRDRSMTSKWLTSRAPVSTSRARTSATINKIARDSRHHHGHDRKARGRLVMSTVVRLEQQHARMNMMMHPPRVVCRCSLALFPPRHTATATTSTSTSTSVLLHGRGGGFRETFSSSSSCSTRVSGAVQRAVVERDRLSFPLRPLLLPWRCIFPNTPPPEWTSPGRDDGENNPEYITPWEVPQPSRISPSRRTANPEFIPPFDPDDAPFTERPSEVPQARETNRGSQI